MVPVPDIEIVCGLPGALSDNANDAVRTPLADGLKVIVTSQLWPAGRLPGFGQVVVEGKSPGFAPFNERPDMVMVALPVFVTVTTFEGLDLPTNWSPNVTMLGETRTEGALLEVEPQLVTNKFASTDPSPVTGSQPIPALKPVSPGTELLPRTISLKTLVLEESA